MGFPLKKLATLYIRRLHAPLIMAVKKNVKESPKFRNVCWKVGDFYQKRDSNVKTKLNKMGAGSSNTEASKSLTPDAAVNLGAELLEEAFTYGFIVLIMLLVYNHAARRQVKNDQDTQYRLKEAERRIAELEMQTEFLSGILRERSKVRPS